MYIAARLTEIDLEENEGNQGVQAGQGNVDAHEVNVNEPEVNVDVGRFGSRQHPREVHLRKKMMARKGKRIALESEHDRPKKRTKHSQEGLDDDIMNMMSEAAKREISYLKTQVMAFREREDYIEREITKLRTMVLTQKKVIEGKQMALERMFGLITNLQTRLNVSQDVSWDDLFDYIGFHRHVGGSSGPKDKEPLEVVNEDMEEEKDEKDDEAGGEKDEQSKKKDDNDEGRDGKSGNPICETADGKIVEDEDVLEDTDNPKSSLDTMGLFKTGKSSPSAVYQNIAVKVLEETIPIIGWKYEHLKDLYAVKRRGNIIQYFNTAHDL
ncbi:hypothetical protein L1987_00947 [Smallanthus sonchifolius]|uniref:Uncharacterized protein n=1 Tax=Smallanthus sonchifolius TaxID=185202 RepID=A0ACB9K3S0_9ASTR|nr:hypothetical protein L1987_00947 [Smallanthus sonchifolius]